MFFEHSPTKVNFFGLKNNVKNIVCMMILTENWRIFFLKQNYTILTKEKACKNLRCAKLIAQNSRKCLFLNKARSFLALKWNCHSTSSDEICSNFKKLLQAVWNDSKFARYIKNEIYLPCNIFPSCKAARLSCYTWLVLGVAPPNPP